MGFVFGIYIIAFIEPLVYHLFLFFVTHLDIIAEICYHSIG